MVGHGVRHTCSTEMETKKKLGITTARNDWLLRGFEDDLGELLEPQERTCQS